MSIHRETKKIQYTYTMKYYANIKRNETVQFAKMGVDLETIIQNEASQTEKNKYHIIALGS